MMLWVLLWAQTGFLSADEATSAAPSAPVKSPVKFPAKVVSINLCTDLLAMQLAATGQLVSVSALATDPHVSPMADAAAGYAINHGRAEEIYQMAPDLVLAASWTNPATLEMFDRLGVPVAVFDAALSFDDVRDRVRAMGDALGRQEAAAAVIADFDARLADLRARPTTHPGAVMFHANGLTTGDDSLSGQMLRAAGFDNLAANAGYRTLDRLPLEILATLAPEAIITATPYPNNSRSESIMQHPLIAALRNPQMGAIHTDNDWFCGTPKVLDAVERLADIRARSAPATTHETAQ